MINFFRNIRRQLASDNKFQKYFRYALGEVVLIMLGILMALQLQNWNEKRKQEAEFKVTLEQIYNSIKFDVDYFKGRMDACDYNMTVIDFLLNHPDSIPNNELPFVLYNLIDDANHRKSETVFHANNLKYNVSNQQNEISKQIINYTNNLNFDNGSLTNDLDAELKKIDLAYPKVDISEFGKGWISKDSTYYSDKTLKNAADLVKSDHFRSILKTLRSKTFYVKAKSFVRYGDGISLMNIIKKQYPDIKLLFNDVGIKGTAIDGFDNVGGLSTPMTLTDIENNIWETDIYLLKGKIKFRCRDSWAQNWGGESFPKGIGTQDGLDILVPEASNYHIIFKPVTGEYEFIKQNN
jgi:hypothetical protein